MSTGGPYPRVKSEEEQYLLSPLSPHGSSRAAFAVQPMVLLMHFPVVILFIINIINNKQSLPVMTNN
jgi:hypothetical protein